MLKLKIIAIGIILLACIGRANALPMPVIPLDSLIKRAKKVQNTRDSLPHYIALLRDNYKTSRNRKALVYADYFDAYYVYLGANHLKAMDMAIACLNKVQLWNVDELAPQMYVLIGNLHKEAHNFPMAFDAANKGLQASRELKDTANIIALLGLKAMFTHSFSLSQHKPANKDGSLELQFEGLKLAESSPKWERIRIRFYDNIAQLYKDRGDYSNAILYANKGVNLATRLNEKRSLTYGLNWLGESLFFTGKQAEGMEIMHKALDISIQINQPFRTMEIYENISELYERAGDYKNALKYVNIHRTMRDSLQVQANTQQISELQLKYETSQKDKNIALLNQANALQNKQMVWVIVASVLFIILAGVLMVMYGIIRKRNSELVASNANVNEQSQKLQLLMQELHHRVKNNLQIVSSLLNLQSSRLVDADARNVLKVSRQRIDAMSIIHQSLYQHDSANMVNFKEYVNSLMNSIMQSFGIRHEDINIRVDILVKDMDVDIALPLGLILNEWITNVFKHAWKDTEVKPHLDLTIFHDGENIKLEIKDNGVGMPDGLWNNPKASFGIKLMKVLMKQIRAVSQITSHPGTMLELDIPYC